MTDSPLFGTPSINDPEVAAAVRLLRATGDEGGAALEMLAADPVPAIRGLAALAHWWGSQLYRTGGSLDEALAAWQNTGELPPPA